jgi:hypothetical protein
MKTVLTLLTIFIFWLNAISGECRFGDKKQKESAQQKPSVARNKSITQTDSISGFLVNINGQSDSIQITKDTATIKSLEADGIHNIESNTIEINGEGNLVNITQDKNGGKVNIKQNGIGNHVNISQSNHNSEK